MIILRQKTYARKDYAGLTNEGKAQLKEYRDSIARDLLEARNKSYKAYREGVDARKAVMSGIVSDLEGAKKSGRVKGKDAKNMDDLVELIKTKFIKEPKKKDREEYSAHLGKLLDHSKKASKLAREAVDLKYGHGGISKTKITPDGKIIKKNK